MNLVTKLETHARREPQKTAVVAGTRKISYGELHENVNRVAVALDRLGLKKGDRVALLMHNCPEYIFSFYAAMKCGLIAVSLNVMFKEEEAGYIFNDAQPAAVIAQESFFPLVEEIQGIVNKTPYLLGVCSTNTCPTGWLSFQDLLREGPGDFPTVDPGSDGEAVIAYTSGTTGFPKGAVHTHRNILVHLDGIQQHLGFGAGDVFLAGLPFFQLVAFLIHPGLALHVGGAVVILEKFEPEAFLKAAKDEAVTFFAAVPTIYSMIYASAAKRKVDLSTVRFGICAGSPISLDLRERFEKTFHFRIIHCYGMTEISLIAACEDPHILPKGVSVGKVLPYLDLRIDDANGRPVGKDEVGEIRIGAERALERYWNLPGETAEALHGGWFETGDMGRFDEEDHLYIVDRKKDMIIRGGFNVYPAEIERVLLEDPRVQEAAVVGIPHSRLGEVPKAFVVLRDKVRTTENDLKALIRSRLAHFKALEEVEFVNSDFFPRNALGKILKTKLRTRGEGDLRCTQ